MASGSVAEGVSRLGCKVDRTHLNKPKLPPDRPDRISKNVSTEAFEAVGCRASQVLLTHDDLADKERYLNARTTMLTLLDLSVIPVINENDTVVTTELSLGDNDTLAGLVSNLIEADHSGYFDRSRRLDDR